MRDGSLVREKLCIKMYLADGAYSTCKAQPSVLPWGSTEKCGAKADPRLLPRGWWNTGFPWKCSSEPTSPGSVRHSESAISAQSPFCLDQTEFTVGNHCTFSSFLTQHWSCCRFPVPVSYREKLCSCLWTGSALRFRHWLMTSAVLLFGLEFICT